MEVVRSLVVDGSPTARVGEVIRQIEPDGDGRHAWILGGSNWRSYAWRWTVLRWSLGDGRVTLVGEGEGEGVGLAARAGRVFVGGHSWEIRWLDLVGGASGAVAIESGETYFGCAPDGGHIVTCRAGERRTAWCRIRAVGGDAVFPEVPAPLVFSDDGRFAVYVGGDAASLAWVSLTDGSAGSLAIGAPSSGWWGIRPVRGATEVIVWDAAQLVVCDLVARRVVARAAVVSRSSVEDAAAGRVILVRDHAGADIVELLDLARGERTWLPGEHRRLALTGDGRRVLVQRGAVLDVVDAGSGAVFSAHEGQCEVVRGLVWARDGGRVASSADDGRVRLIGTGGPVRELAGELGQVRRIVWSPDGRRLCAVTAAGIEVVDAATGAITGRLASFGTHIHSAEISQDSRLLVIGSYSHGCRVIDLATGEHVAGEREATARASLLVLAGEHIVALGHERVAGAAVVSPFALVHWVRLDLAGRVLARGTWRFEEADSDIELRADAQAAMVAWHPRGGRCLCTFDLAAPERAGRAVPIPAGARLVDCRNGRALFVEAGEVVCRDPGTGGELWRVRCPRWPWLASLSYRGDAVAVAYRDWGVEVFSAGPGGAES